MSRGESIPRVQAAGSYALCGQHLHGKARSAKILAGLQTRERPDGLISPQTLATLSLPMNRRVVENASGKQTESLPPTIFTLSVNHEFGGNFPRRKQVSQD